MRFAPDFLNERGVSSVIAGVLLIALVVLLSVVVATFGLGFSDDLGGPKPTAATITLDSTATGINANVERVEEPVEVRVNGVTLYNVSKEDVGETLFLPTAPGDSVTVIAQDEEESLVLNKRVDPSEAGKYILDHDMGSQAGTNIEDHSGNDNKGVIGTWTGTVGGVDQGTEPDGPEWRSDNGTYLRFNNGDAAKATNISLDGPNAVEEFTVATKVRVAEDTGNVQQFVEYRANSSFEWFIETKGFSGDKYRVDYHPFFPDSATSIETGYVFEKGEQYVFFGNYNGTHATIRAYHTNGTLVYEESLSMPATYRNNEMPMGKLWVGNDLDAGQPLRGDMHELRLYYVALNDDEMQTVVKAITDS